MVITHTSSDKSIEGLAIIDGHSTMTLIHPDVIDHLQPEASSQFSTLLSTHTIHGTSQPTTHRGVNGLQIRAFHDPQVPQPLPPCYVNEHLPNVIEEVPSHNELLTTPGFEELVQYFPEKNPTWDTIILVCRDCLWAQGEPQDRNQ